MNSLTKFKTRLARVRVGSFRYTLASIYPDHRLRNARACSFYWWYLPSSAVAWAGIGFLWFMWFLVTYLIIVPLGWLAGFSPERVNNFDDADPSTWEWHGYGYDPITKKQHTLAYQHVLLILAAIGTLMFFSGSIAWNQVLLIAGSFVGTVALITAIGFTVTRKAVKEGWHRICPPLEVKD